VPRVFNKRSLSQPLKTSYSKRGSVEKHMTKDNSLKSGVGGSTRGSSALPHEHYWSNKNTRKPSKSKRGETPNARLLREPLKVEPQVPLYGKGGKKIGKAYGRSGGDHRKNSSNYQIGSQTRDGVKKIGRARPGYSGSGNPYYMRRTEGVYRCLGKRGNMHFGPSTLFHNRGR